MTKNAQSTHLVRLPLSVKAEVERFAKADGVSINQFVATAGAEKLAAITAAFCRAMAIYAGHSRIF
jgi:predicted HicB family RNase H-like nuclease